MRSEPPGSVPPMLPGALDQGRGTSWAAMGLPDPAELARFFGKLGATEAALEHIRADHEMLRALWDLHIRNPHPLGGLRPGGWCKSCGQHWPCDTRRILAGESS